MRKISTLICAGILIFFAVTFYVSYISMPLLRVMLILMATFFAFFLYVHIHTASNYIRKEEEKVKQALKECERSKFFLSLLNLHSPIVHAVIDRDFTIQFVNEAVEKVTGY